MARSIAKAINDSIIYAIRMGEIENIKTVTLQDADGNDIEVSYTDVLIVKGNYSIAKAQRYIEQLYDDRNVCVSYVYIDEKEKLTLSSDTFIANSDVCAAGLSYGHDTVTSEFKVTYIDAMYIDKGKPVFTQLVYSGTTTNNKLLNFVRDSLKNPMACIKSTNVVTERRWMLKTTYERLARAEMKQKRDSEQHKF